LLTVPDVAVPALTQQCAGLKVVVMMTEVTREPTIALYRAGVSAVIGRYISEQMLLKCLYRVGGGQKWIPPGATDWFVEALHHDSMKRLAGGNAPIVLNAREQKIVDLILEQLKNRAIAVHLGTTEQVIKNCLHNIYAKVGVSDRLGLVMHFMAHKQKGNLRLGALPQPTAAD
jgi:DNA-binding NarL/FixJ family response regulator